MLTGVPESTPAVMQGPLSQVALAQILRAVFVGGLTGRLRFTRDGESLDLRFLSGHIVSGSSEPLAGRLGEIMVRSGVLSRRDLDQSGEQAVREGRRLGPVLFERRLASLAQIEEALRLQVRGVLFSAFSWHGGAFQFEPNDGLPTSLEEISLRLSTGQLILEVVSSFAEPPSVREALGDLDRRLGAVEDPRVRLEGVTLSPGDAFVLSRADGALTAQQILDITPLPRETVEQSLLSLLSVGIVEWRTTDLIWAVNPSHTVTLAKDEVRRAVQAPPVHETEIRRREIDETFTGLIGKTHHEVLGVPSGANVTEVRDAYQRLTRRYHPDTAGKMPAAQAAKVHAIFMRVSEAFNALRAESRSAPTDSDPAERPTAEAVTPVPGAAPESGPSLEEALTKAEEALAQRPWDTLAAVDRLLPEATGPLLQRARLLRARAQLRNPISWRDGENGLRDLQKEDPTSVDAPLLLGGFYKERGLTARAAGMFSKVLELKPGHRRATEELRSLPPSEPGAARVRRAS